MVKRQRCRLYQNKNLTKGQGFSLGGGSIGAEEQGCGSISPEGRAWTKTGR